MSKEHSGGLDLLKLVMSLMVVGIHTNPFVSYSLLDSLTSNGIFRVAVPVFFVLNGYFLALDPARFWPWMKRIVGLYLLLSLLFAPYWIDKTSLSAAGASLLLNLVFGWHHLWYLAALIVAALVIFALQRYLRALFVASLILFVAATVLQFSALLQPDGVAGFAHGRYFIYRNAFTVALPFLLTGYLLARSQFRLRWAGVVVPLALLLMVAEIVGWDRRLPDASQSRELYFSLLLVAPVLFLGAQQLRLRLHDKLSARIYFFHPVFEMGFKSHGMYSGLKMSLATTVLSVLLAYGIHLLKSGSATRQLRILRLLP